MLLSLIIRPSNRPWPAIFPDRYQKCLLSIDSRIMILIDVTNNTQAWLVYRKAEIFNLSGKQYPVSIDRPIGLPLCIYMNRCKFDVYHFTLFIIILLQCISLDICIEFIPCVFTKIMCFLFWKHIVSLFECLVWRL